MSLVPFSPHHLQLNHPLPFGIRDASGRLLLAAGARVDQADKLERLKSAELFADAAESMPWRRRLANTVDTMLRDNAPLAEIAEVRLNANGMPAPRSSDAAPAASAKPAAAKVAEGPAEPAATKPPASKAAAPDAVGTVALRAPGQARGFTGVSPSPLARIAAARASQDTTFGEQWDELIKHSDLVQREARPDGEWLSRLHAVHARALALFARKPDASLYHLIYTSAHSTERYSALHGLLCLVVSREVARMVGWPDELLDSLEAASLTMNVSMRRLQDLLAAGEPRITPDMRAEIDNHPERSVALLRSAGVQDPVWLTIVQHHHDDFGAGVLPDSAEPGLRAAQVLARVDVFTAKISRRAPRAPMSPLMAARQGCLGPDGRPDELGSALLRAMGLYPPGSFVELANGEAGIVISRGRMANQPVVAALMSASGAPLSPPMVRNAWEGRFAVKRVMGPDELRVRPPHEQLMSLR